VFVSGFVFEVTKNTEVTTLDVPYSITMSNDRIGFVGIYNNDDVNCAKWLSQTDDRKVWVDYLGMSLMIDYTEYVKGVYLKPESSHFLFLHTWNIEHEKMVFGWRESSREYAELPDLNNYIEIYRQGKAVVYESK
jgi:hypothetical protein